MTQIKSNIPKIRFKEFSWKWGEKRLWEISSKFWYWIWASAIKYDWINKYLRITDIDDKSRSFIPKPLTSPWLEIENKYILEKNDIVFARTGASVWKSYLYNVDDWKLIFAWFLIKTNIDKADSFFVYTQTLRANYDRWVKIMSMRSGQPWINAEEYKSFKFFLPQLSEQQKIASFLYLIDKKIENVKEKKKSLEEYKKGVMQKIFSREIRFKDENGDSFGEWEDKKLEELIEYKNWGSFENNVVENWEYNLITLNSIDINWKIKDFHKKVNITDNSLIKWDLIMVLSDVAHWNFLWLTDIIPWDNYVLNQRMWALKPKINLNRFFLKNLINYNQKYFKLHWQGSSQQNLSKWDILKFTFWFPSISEQEKIADFLIKFDKKIENIWNELDKMEDFKKGLLQSMFV